MAERTPLRKEYQYEMSAIEQAAWNLVYNMIEAGVEPSEGSWWEQEWLWLRRCLEMRGLNVDPY